MPHENPLPPTVASQLTQLKIDLSTPGTKLGHLARRFAMAARDMHDSIAEYGSAVVVPIAGQDHSVPVRCQATLALSVQVGSGEPQRFEVTVGSGLETAPRPEARLGNFGITVNVPAQ